MKIIFIDNDNSKDDFELACDQLETWFGVSENTIKTITPHYMFLALEKDKQHELLFDEADVIVTYSMYARNFGNHSLAQFGRIMAYAGMCKIENKIYIDTSARLSSDFANLANFNFTLNDSFHILQALERNTILTLGSDYTNGPQRLKFDPSNERMVSLEPFNLIL